MVDFEVFVYIRKFLFLILGRRGVLWDIYLWEVVFLGKEGEDEFYLVVVGY